MRWRIGDNRSSYRRRAREAARGKCAPSLALRVPKHRGNGALACDGRAPGREALQILGDDGGRRVDWRRVRPTVLLYDIDGTLISTAGAGRRAIERAFAQRFGRDDVLDFPFDGMTDPVIVRLGLRRLGLAEAAIEREIAPTLSAYLDVLGAVCASATDFRIHPGIEAALALTVGRGGFAVGLGTGNVAEGARLKLERVGLHSHFAFGGYGSDDGDRPTLLRIGAERGAARLKAPLGACRVVVIGDTPKDIAAAHAIGAEAIAVATGSFGVEALRSYSPKHAFVNLTHPAAATAILED
jgi:phosphoglycolate phosphatase